METPHLGALAESGTRLTDLHSNGAVRGPTRAALLTGRYQQRCGITAVLTEGSARDQGLPRSEVVLPALLEWAGYATGIVGKRHLGYRPTFSPVHFGFDCFHGDVSGNGETRNLAAEQTTIRPDLLRALERWEADRGAGARWGEPTVTRGDARCCLPRLPWRCGGRRPSRVMSRASVWAWRTDALCLTAAHSVEVRRLG